MTLAMTTRSIFLTMISATAIVAMMAMKVMIIMIVMKAITMVVVRAMIAMGTAMIVNIVVASRCFSSLPQK